MEVAPRYTLLTWFTLLPWFSLLTWFALLTLFAQLTWLTLLTCLYRVFVMDGRGRIIPLRLLRLLEHLGANKNPSHKLEYLISASSFQFWSLRTNILPNLMIAYIFCFSN